MSHGVLALGAGALFAAGCVWYLPAVVDVRAGLDRPLSIRLAAVSLLIGWGSVALTGALLLTPLHWHVIAAVAVAAVLVAVAVRGLALVRRNHERREEWQIWAALRPDTPSRHGRPSQPGGGLTRPASDTREWRSHRRPAGE
ncbi:hypothetical protein [Streptomyces sp. NPDC003077]|uniref:hypothetical protein n=1 Tax=Streptomyces sp. NPDC003077 TaxID=3154443 RepID=UPI0033AAC041